MLTPGIKPSQMPESPRRSSKLASLSPFVEAADHRDQPRIRRPHAEHDAGLDAAWAVLRSQMRAQGFVEAVVAAFVEEVEILRGEERGVIGDGNGCVGHGASLVYRKMRARGVGLRQGVKYQIAWKGKADLPCSSTEDFWLGDCTTSNRWRGPF